MVHSARPLSTPQSSLASKVWNGARRAASGERKEHVLQSGRRLLGLCPQFVERPDPAQPPVREQHEAITYAFGIEQLMDGENEGAPPPRDVSKHTHDLARLPQIETVERLVHQQQRMGGQ